ncbi:glycosyltransferase family 61 protein [Paenibacillus dendritiformis]|uniref:Capsular polysaccharide biosynthesis protein-like protein n=1 Tax=Paenibacillus dendritiformis C454 TaxID=1131935 RepID=H3SB05_9BACL|nr:glycosyltransferase family 61 protein [Paenibacillus dendritiformis]EHQ63738.1 Capsular polysaccharide biosynthesis protein-like protein [Paenibacillus dendritiformis C454]CAH8772498.1 glycosyltransferase family 61 protein [Paenibacillus dendritiformis]
MNTIPNLFYHRTRDWAAGYAYNLSLLQERYKIIYPEETVVLPAPKGVDLPRWPPLYHTDEAFVAVIPEGRVMTGCGYVVTPDHRRLLDVELAYPYPFIELPPPQYTTETVATLLWGWNIPGFASTQAIFGHWFFDILPRIHLLEQSGIAIDKYLIGQLTHPFQYESLQMLGFPMDKLIQVDRNDFHLVARKLVVPAVPFILGGCPRWASQFIRSRLKDAHSIPPRPGYERIYVSRQDAHVRHVINEEEVMQVLAEKGFVRIVLTPLSMADKIAIYSSAQVIVSPFGSGSINTAFCNPGSTLIELTPVTVMDGYFWKISNHAGMNYYEVVCDIEQPPKPLGGADNLIVDIEKLKRVLHMAGI